MHVLGIFGRHLGGRRRCRNVFVAMSMLLHSCCRVLCALPHLCEHFIIHVCVVVSYLYCILLILSGISCVVKLSEYLWFSSLRVPWRTRSVTPVGVFVLANLSIEVANVCFHPCGFAREPSTWRFCVCCLCTKCIL